MTHCSLEVLQIKVYSLDPASPFAGLQRLCQEVLRIWLSFCASLSFPFNTTIISFYPACSPGCLVLWAVSLEESNLSGKQKQTALHDSARLYASPPDCLLNSRLDSLRGCRGQRGGWRIPTKHNVSGHL